MYLFLGVLTALGVTVETAFLIAAPLGVLGFCCWVFAFIICLLQFINKVFLLSSIGALFSSVIPLAFLAFGFWVAANGGV